MQTIALKFGGSSLASAEQYRKVAAIIRADPARRYIIASAPGKRSSGDTKITDALYAVFETAQAGGDYESTLAAIADRYRGIAGELGVRFDIDGEIGKIRRRIETRPERDYLASRGEYLGSRLLASYLDVPFVDAEGTVVFREDGTLDAQATNRALGGALMGLARAVVPGFYGADAHGTIHTFSRGGSDVTGALVARAVRASLYENWTDVSGMEGVGAALLSKADAVTPGSVVRGTGRVADVGVGESLLGRVVDPIGRPLDGLPLIPKDFRTCEFPAPAIIDRAPVDTPLETGILAIDSMARLRNSGKNVNLD